MIGVATSDAPLHAVGYQSLVGNTDKSWGWDLGRLKAFHNNLQCWDLESYLKLNCEKGLWKCPVCK